MCLVAVKLVLELGTCSVEGFCRSGGRSYGRKGALDAREILLFLKYVCVGGGGGVYGKCQFVPCIQGFKALCNNKNIIDIQGVKKHVLQTLRGRGRIAQNIQMDSFGDTEDYSFW